MNMGDKPCFTCKDRKISCDRASPVCRNCLRAKRVCQRFALRLSWPRKNDRKRAILGHSQSCFSSTGKMTQFNFLNTTSQDVEISECISDPFLLHAKYRQMTNAYAGPVKSLSSRPSLDCSQTELIPYFFSIVLPSLPAFGIDLEKLRGVVTRLSILDDSAPSQAVLYSSLALAAQYQSGDQRKATKFIISALNSLRISAEKEISCHQAMQHLITGMLLCAYEIHANSHASSLWIWYLFNTKGVVKKFYQQQPFVSEDGKLLFEWIFYYDTLTKLAMKHWRGCQLLQLQLKKELGLEELNPMCFNNEITEFADCTNNVLALLSEYSAGVLSPAHPRYRSPEYISWLHGIENQLHSIRQDLQKHDSLHDLDNQSETIAVKEIFILAALLYIERSSTDLAGSSIKTDEWIQDGFRILSTLEHCNKPFPLLIFATEAETESQRLLILQIIDRALESAKSNSLTNLKDLLAKIWVQADLNVGGNMDHQRKTCYGLGISDFLPCLI